VNPGLSATFPWLANLAANFEKYRFKKLRFFYKSSVSTVAQGSVMLAIDLDALDAPPASKAVMLQMQTVVRSNVWQECSSTLPESVGELFTRSGAVPAGADAKTYDCGQLIVGTVGTTAGMIGEVWFEYDVELHTPQVTQASVQSLAIRDTGGELASLASSGSLAYSVNSSSSFTVQTAPGTTYLVNFIGNSAERVFLITGPSSVTSVPGNPVVGIENDRTSYSAIIVAGEMATTISFSGPIATNRFVFAPLEQGAALP
jgi:hypothetical protein